MTDLTSMTIAEAREGLANKSFTSLELTDAHLAAIEAARSLIGLELIEDGVHRLVGIGGLALPLHRVEIVHVGLIGLFIVAEQTHRTSDLAKRFYSTTFGTKKK